MKKIFLFFAMITVAFTACKDKNVQVKGMTSDEPATTTEKAVAAKLERNRKAAIASNEGYNQHDSYFIFKYAAKGMVDYGDGSQPPTTDTAKMHKQTNELLSTFPDIKVEKMNALSYGDWVAVWGQWSGTWTGEYKGQKPNGKKFIAQDVDIYKFNDAGLITEHHNIQSFDNLARQVGIKVK